MVDVEVRVPPFFVILLILAILFALAALVLAIWLFVDRKPVEVEDVTVKKIFEQDVEFTGKVVFREDVIVERSLSAGKDVQASGNLITDGDLRVGKDATIDGQLTVRDDAVFDGDVAITGSLTAPAIAFVGAVSFPGAVAIGGPLTVASGPTTIAGNMTVSGDVTVSGDFEKKEYVIQSRRSVPLLLFSGVTAQVPFDVDEKNSNWTTSRAFQEDFLAPKTGWYEICYNIEFDTSSSGNRFVAINVNGARLSSLEFPCATADTTTQSGMFSAFMNSGQVTSLEVQQTSGGNLNLLNARINLRFRSTAPT